MSETLAYSEFADLCRATGLEIQVGVHVELLAEEVPPFTGRGTYTFTYAVCSKRKRAMRFGLPNLQVTFRLADMIVPLPFEITAFRVYYLERDNISRLDSPVTFVTGADITLDIADSVVPWPR